MVAGVVARLVDDMVLHTVIGLQHGRDQDLIAEERLPDGSSSCKHHQPRKTIQRPFEKHSCSVLHEIQYETQPLACGHWQSY